MRSYADRPAKFRGLPLGEGVVSSARDYGRRIIHALIGRRSGAPPAVRQFLAEHGNEKVQSLSICREPINFGVKLALNALTAGNFSKVMRRLRYEDVFHLWMVMVLPSGTYRFDKDEVVHMYKNAPAAGTCMPVSLARQVAVRGSPTDMTVEGTLTPAVIFANGEAQNSSYWLYDTYNNCQRFIMDNLRGSGLLTPELQKFVLQDTKSLVSGMAKRVADTVTDIAGRFDIVRSGVGMMPPPPLEKPRWRDPSLPPFFHTMGGGYHRRRIRERLASYND